MTIKLFDLNLENLLESLNLINIDLSKINYDFSSNISLIDISNLNIYNLYAGN